MNVIDLFAGAGGLCEGFLREGYNIVSHIEMDKNASMTLQTRSAYYHLKENRDEDIYYSYLTEEINREELLAECTDFHDPTINEEITEKTITPLIKKVLEMTDKTGLKNIDGIIGGPPCQAYSYAGRARVSMENDPRNYLYKYYLKFLEEFKPQFFVFENVPGMVTAKCGSVFEHFIKEVKELGYIIHPDYSNPEISSSVKSGFFLDAFDFGVPQQRRRIIITGTLSPFDGYESFKDKYPGLVRDVLGDLPPLEPGEGSDGPQEYATHTSAILEKTGIRSRKDTVINHRARTTNPRDREIYGIVIKTWNDEKRRLRYTELPEHLRPFRNTESFRDRFKVVAGDLPCSHTVVAHISKDGHYYIHPDIEQRRSITVREAARLQSFPDNYKFEGSRTSQYRQVGNAVPPIMAQKIAMAIRKFIDG